MHTVVVASAKRSVVVEAADDKWQGLLPTFRTLTVRHALPIDAHHHCRGSLLERAASCTRAPRGVQRQASSQQSGGGAGMLCCKAD